MPENKKSLLSMEPSIALLFQVTVAAIGLVGVWYTTVARVGELEKDMERLARELDAAEVHDRSDHRLFDAKLQVVEDRVLASTSSLRKEMRWAVSQRSAETIRRLLGPSVVIEDPQVEEDFIEED